MTALARIQLLVLILLQSAFSVAADTPEAYVVLSLPGGEQERVQGQEYPLSVKLYTGTWLRKAPRYPEIDVEGALVVRPLSFATHGQETVDGHDYIVQEQIYRVYPQRLGAFYVPPVQLSMSLARVGGTAQPLRVQSNDLIFTVAQQREGLIAANVEWEEEYRLIAGERSSRLPLGELWSLQQGDVIERKITLKAGRTTSILLPDFRQLQIESEQGDESVTGVQFSQQTFAGGKLYRQVSQLGDQDNRGEFLAVREEIWRYEFNEGGQFVIPAMVLSYWNLSEEAQQRLTLPAQSVDLSAPFQWRRTAWGVAGGGLALFLLMWFLKTYRRRNGFAFLAQKPLLKRSKYSGESDAWRALCASLRQQDRQAFNRHLSQWARFWNVNPTRVRVLVTSRYTALPKYLSTLYSRDGSAVRMMTLDAIEQGQLLNELQALRRQLKGSKKTTVADTSPCLPPLNPSPKS
ncbi:hypothetical protein [Pseudoteredinibacter isoporae]|uniref:hypothetical protein n=1 Tax=Pseudoteredinibacter isoporae TaxID=570281 RepID=UPI00310A37A4